MRETPLLPSVSSPTAPLVYRNWTSPRPYRASRARTAAAALAAVAALALTACSAGTEGTRDEGRGAVDTLVSTSPQTGASTPAGKSSSGSKTTVADAKRPQLRLDTSEEEANRLWDTYWACLQAHGVPMNTKRVAAAGPNGETQQAPPLDWGGPVKPKYRPAHDACQAKMPLEPPEYDAEKNPHFAEDNRAAVKCMRSKGLKVHVPGGSDMEGLWWTYDEDQSGALKGDAADRAERECTLEAFGGK